MTPVPDLQKPTDDPYSLIGNSWPTESEQSYRSAEVAAGDASTAASTQAQSAADAESKMVDERGRTAESVSGGYASVSEQLGEHARNLTTVSAWMTDSAAKIEGAKRRIRQLVSTGTSAIRDALESELAGTSVTPSSATLTDHYRGEVGCVAATLATELDGIGRSLVGDPGASRTPTYVRTAESPKTPTVEQAAVHHSITGEGPHVEPHQLPEMPRAASAPSGTESPNAPGTPSAPNAPTHSVNPTLANLVSGSGPSGTPTAPSAKSSSGTTSGTPAGTSAGQAQQPEQRQSAKSPVLPRIPSIGLPNLPMAAQDIATAVSSATTQQLPTPPSAPGSAQIPASTGFTPGTSGTPPVTPAPPAGLSPVGGFPTTPVVQTPPAPQASPATPTPGAQTPSAPQSPAPAAPRGPVADLAWLQRTYGLSPSLDLPKGENESTPALFIAYPAEGEAHLHRVLATLRHAFEQSGWGQPMAVGLIRRGFETKTVYVTADAVSIHPHGVLLPHGVTPLDEMTGTPTAPELLGSLMVSDKLVSMIPRGWTVESVLSTVPCGESAQSTEQCQALVDAEELLSCKVGRGQDDVGVDEALSTFARAALGSAGCGERDVESARLRAARWVGAQPSGYLDVLSRWCLADAAESMSAGRWGEAVYSSERYMSIRQSKAQVA